MYTPNDYILQTIRCDVPYATRADAVAALNAFVGHRIGQQITLLYKDSAKEDEKGDVHCLIAMGIKDSSACGAEGMESTDKWENKHYDGDPHGMEFYRIIADSGERDAEGFLKPIEDGGGQGQPDDGDILDQLGTTHLNMASKSTDLLNPDGDDVTIEDPFSFKPLDEASIQNEYVDNE